MNNIYMGVINTEETTARPGAGVVINPNNTLTGYSLGTQFVDSLTGGSITVRELVHNEMTREKTLEEMQNIRSFLEAKYKAEQAEQLGFWGKIASGWQSADINNLISIYKNKLNSLKKNCYEHIYHNIDSSHLQPVLNKENKNCLDEIKEIQDRIAKYQWKSSQILIPKHTDTFSAYNIGYKLREFIPIITLLSVSFIIIIAYIFRKKRN